MKLAQKIKLKKNNGLQYAGALVHNRILRETDQKSGGGTGIVATEGESVNRIMESTGHWITIVLTYFVYNIMYVENIILYVCLLL